MNRKIFWLASYPKSGNTWIRMFLDVYVTGFPVNFNTAYRYVNLDHDLGMLQLVSAIPVNTLTLEQQFLYQPAMLSNILYQAKTKDVIVKTHNANITISGIPLIPEPLTGGVIYIVRDPRDVLLSYASHLNKTHAEVAAIMNNMQHVVTSKLNRLFHVMTSWSYHVDSWVGKRKQFPVYVVKYENLLREPEKLFKEILNFLDIIDINEERFQYALEQTIFANLSKKYKITS